MPWILLIAAGAWFFLSQEKAKAALQQSPSPASAKKPAAKSAAKRVQANSKSPIRVTIGPAVITHSEASALPLGARTPYQDALAIKSAAKASGIKLPDKVAAKKQAQGIANNVSQRGSAYDVHALQAWQILAGCPTQTGDYDRPTQTALKNLGASGVASKTYTRSKSAPYAVK